MLRKLSFAITIIFLLLLASCIPFKKRVYFSQIKDIDTAVTFTENYNSYRLKANDIVRIQFRSVEEEDNEFFNTSLSSGSGNNSSSNRQLGSNGGNGDVFFLTGYAINDSGFILVPQIGEIVAAGFTVDELNEELKKKYSVYFKEGTFTITVKIAGIRFNVFGEVGQPGQHSVMLRRLNIYQAISAAGEFNSFANREHVLLMRQYENETKVVELNLMDPKIIESEFFYIWPNDHIFVKPYRVSKLGIGDNFLSVLGTTTALITTPITIYLLYRSINN